MSSLSLRFDNSLCIFATKRSGHHAIINWIAMNMPQSCIHFNDININILCEPDSSPVINYNRKSLFSWSPPQTKMLGGSPAVTNKGLMIAVIYDQQYNTSIKMNGTQNQISQFIKKYRSSPGGINKFLTSINQEIINFENISYTSHRDNISQSLYFKNKHVRIIGILRDYYNTLASYLKSNQSSPTDKTILELTAMTQVWLSLANEYIKNPKNTILFNLWQSDQDYRFTVCKHLGLNNNDHGYDKISSFGGGSSFGKKPNNLHHRYREMIDEPLFRKFAYNSQIIELNKNIFNLEIF
tara:strand:+ start:898 stop:1788 length:891 start_codon:yes stop_codon:yes gene_type:complete